MEKSSIKPDRQMLLLGVVAIGLASAAFYALQPEVKLARQDSAPAFEDEADEPLDFEYEAEETSLAESEPEALEEVVEAVPANVSRFVRKKKALDPAAASSVMPRPYAERLALLNEERELMLRRTQTAPTLDAVEEAPFAAAPTVTLTLVDATDAEPAEVVQAVAESDQPETLRQVQTIGHRRLAPAAAPEAASRGAWLSGVIELE